MYGHRGDASTGQLVRVDPFLEALRFRASGSIFAEALQRAFLTDRSS